MRSLSLRNESWVAEVLPLEEGKSKGVFSLDKKGRALVVPLAETSPVKAYFVRAENGYNISMDGSSRPALRAPSFRVLSSNFTLPRKKSVSIAVRLPVTLTRSQILNAESLAVDMAAYSQLKKR